MAVQDATNIIWLDLEMTGLDEQVERILEVSVVVTTGHSLQILSKASVVLKTEASVLAKMGAWCINTHTKSKLVEDCQQPADIVLDRFGGITVVDSLQKAQDIILAAIEPYCPEGMCPLGGNSNSTDRMFMKKYMPRLYNYLHYRTIDVSTITEVVKRCNPKILENAPAKTNQHRAYPDIIESIEELKFYMKNMFLVERN